MEKYSGLLGEIGGGEDEKTRRIRMTQIHFLNVENGDCSIIKHDSGRLSVIDVCCARKILTEQGVESVSVVKKVLKTSSFP